MEFILLAAILTLLPAGAFARAFVMPEGLSKIQRQRLERFESFQIKGVRTSIHAR